MLERFKKKKKSKKLCKDKYTENSIYQPIQISNNESQDY